MNDISCIGVAADAANAHIVTIAAATTNPAIRMQLSVLGEESAEVLFLRAAVGIVFAVFFAFA